jgi:diketogulonate reductase-like aldo/keto reductase
VVNAERIAMPAPFEPTSLADTVEIAAGVPMPRLGLGTYKANQGSDVEGEVRYGLSIGYRLVDTAALYGNEASIGAVVRESGIPREDLFITTKLWNSDQAHKRVAVAFERSLRKLGMDYVDLYLVHWPWPTYLRETWTAMEKILASGRARAIGVCNHLPHHLDTLASFADVMPAVNQCEFHPHLQQPELQAACDERDIVLQAWAPIMRGRVNLVPEIVGIAGRHEKTPAQVTLRWILQKGVVTIPKSIHEHRIAENCDLYDFVLSAEEMAIIDSLDDGTRLGPDPDVFAASGSVAGLPKPR